MRHLESSFQIAAVRLLRANGYYCFSVPNGTRLSRTQARLAKAEGVLSGVSDIIILLNKKPVFVEFKSLNVKGKQQPTQKEFEAEVTARGFEYMVWDSWAQVEEFINAHRKER